MSSPQNSITVGADKIVIHLLNGIIITHMNENQLLHVNSNNLISIEQALNLVYLSMMMLRAMVENSVSMMTTV